MPIYASQSISEIIYSVRTISIYIYICIEMVLIEYVIYATTKTLNICSISNAISRAKTSNICIYMYNIIIIVILYILYNYFQHIEWLWSSINSDKLAQINILFTCTNWNPDINVLHILHICINVLITLSN